MSETADVRVRRAEAGDRDELWPLARDLATSFALDRSSYDASFEKLVTHPQSLLIVAGTPGAGVCGYLLAFTHDTFLANGPVAWVDELMVARGARRTGIGRMLIAAAEDWSGTQGAAYIALATRRAADFYVAVGYGESATYFRKLLTAPRPGISGHLASRPPEGSQR